MPPLQTFHIKLTVLPAGNLSRNLHQVHNVPDVHLIKPKQQLPRALSRSLYAVSPDVHLPETIPTTNPEPRRAAYLPRLSRAYG